MKHKLVYILLFASLAGNAVEGGIPTARWFARVMRSDQPLPEPRGTLWNYVLAPDCEWRFDSLDHEIVLVDRRIDSLIRADASDSLFVEAALDRYADLYRQQYELMFQGLRTALRTTDAAVRRKTERRWRMQMGLERKPTSGPRR